MRTNEVKLSDQSIVFYDDNFPKLKIGDDLISISETSLPKNGWKIMETNPEGNKADYFSSLAIKGGNSVINVWYEKEGYVIHFGLYWAVFPPMVIYVEEDGHRLFDAAEYGILKRYGMIWD